MPKKLFCLADLGLPEHILGSYNNTYMKMDLLFPLDSFLYKVQNRYLENWCSILGTTSDILKNPG